MDIEQVKQEINEEIRYNGQKLITGDKLNKVLNDMMDAAGEAAGTAVEANPVGEATDTLEKIKIDGLVYDIPESGVSSVTYVHFMYSENQPTQDIDIHPILSANDKYIGIYVGPLGPPPQNYTQYQWAKFVGDNGQNGLTPHIDPTTKHWMIGLTDTGIVAEGQNGQNGAPGQNGENGVTPHIDPTTKHWMIGLTDTGIVAEGQNGQNGTNGITPSINPSNKHWMIGETDTGIVAEGQDGTDAYVHIKYSQNQPTQDSDMHASPQIGDKYIGVYSGTSSTAPTAYTSYTWSKYVGENGANGANGQSIKYINLNDAEDLPEPSATYSNIVALVPSTTEQGVVDQYACIENAVVEGQTISGWSWVYIGTTAPIVSVQEVDTYQPLLRIMNLTGYSVYKSGAITASGSLNLAFFDIGEAKSIIADFTVPGAVQSAVLSFFDNTFDPDDWANTSQSSYLGWRIDKATAPYVVSSNTNFYNQIIKIDDDATLGSGDITGAKYVSILYVSNNLAECRTLTPVPQSLVKKTATPNEILYFITTIQKPFVTDMAVGTNQEITETDALSPWAVIFPTSYSNTGKPTPVIAMLHGLGGIVTSEVMGYSGNGYKDTRQAYLDAGFAVMDINGTGISTESDANSKHWGNPCAIETLDKAWEYLKLNYNVSDNLLLAGISMGAVLAMGYAKCFPGKVAAVACFAPNPFAYSMRYIGADSSSLKESAWQYTDHAAAAADNYDHLTGYVVLNKCQEIDANGFLKEYNWPDTKPSDWPANLTDLKLVDYFPVPMRIWQGTADPEVDQNCTKLIVASLRRGNCDVTLRLCLNAVHDVQNEQYVRNEAVSWFKRFVNV